jgi:hypothetical protein
MKRTAVAVRIISGNNPAGDRTTARAELKKAAGQ